jgi:hypothetical protein
MQSNMITDLQISKVMSALGSRTSKKKAKASRKNGKLGGRPKKKDAQCQQTKSAK